ncbi:MAG: hypothetical protein QOE92_725 [Chloroflexota bacterium]|nr:hypothetical protein [Chloroflexota bacterium]
MNKVHARWARLCCALLAACLLLVAAPPGGARAATGDWPTYLGDDARSGANAGESTLAPGNAVGLGLRWTFATGGVIAASAAVVDGVVYVGSWDGYEYALDAATGALRWKTFLGVTTGGSGCSNPHAAGISSAATVTGGVVYVGGGDAYWYALDAGTGAVLWKVFAGDNSAASGHYNWASPLIHDGYAYVGVSSLGDCPLVQGQLLQVSLSSHAVVNTFNFAPNGQVGGGIWTSPALDTASNSILLTTGTRAGTQPLSQAVVSLDATSLALKGAWTLPHEQEVVDSDWGTTPLLSSGGGKNLVTAVNKNGYAYTFDRDNINAGPLWRTQTAVGGDCPTCGDGTVSSGATANGLLFLGGGNQVINGRGWQGAVQALDPATGAFVWQHGTSSPVVAAMAYANGLIFDGAGATLEVLDATNGTRLYSYRTGATIYGSPAVAGGQVYAGSVDGRLYAFGLQPPPPPPSDPGCQPGFTCQDIGGGPPGTESFSGGSYSITSSGAGAGGTSDQVRYISQAWAGDGEVTARVASLPGAAGAAAAQAGLMVRQRSDAGSPYYAVLLNGANQLVVQHRAAFGGATTVDSTVAGTAPPRYLKVQRSGDTFQASTSTDGVTYTLVPGATVQVPLPATAMYGVAAASGTAGSPGTATVDHVVIGALGAAAQSPPPASPCPASWTCADIGNPAVIGNQSASGATWNVQGAGNEISNYADQGHFVWQSLAGDGTISGRVTAFSSSDGNARAGLMMRQDASGTAAEYGAFALPGGNLAVQYRPADGLRTYRLVTVAQTMPVYIEVARNGNTYSTFSSTDGASYAFVPGSTISIGTAGSVLAGAAVSSHNAGALASATFEDVATGTNPPPVPSTCEQDWTCEDIGNPLPAGTDSVTDGTWTVLGGGNDIWGTGDQFRFEHQPLAGNGAATARVISQGNTSSWAKAGVMLRQSSDPGAAFYAALVTPGNGVQVQFRATQGAAAQSAASVGKSTPVYVQVSRTGSSFTAYTSADGTTWTAVPGSTRTLGNLTGTLLGGLAVTSHNNLATSSVTFDTVGVVDASPNPTPVVCASPWTCGDIGGPTPPGTQNLNPTAGTVTGGGGDIWMNSDQFRMAWQSLPGDGTLSARVVSQGNTNAWAKAGLMLRAGTAAGAVEYSLLTTPGNGTVVQVRRTTGGSTTKLAAVSGAAPAWLRVSRSGTTFTAYTSTNGTAWTLVPGSSTSLPAGGTMLAGLAVTSHNTGALSTTSFESVSLVGPGPACPSGWTCADIGGATPAGSQWTSSDGLTWTVNGGGGDIWMASDQFRYVSHDLAADGGVSARVVSQANTNAWAKAGVMIRQSADPGAPEYSALVTPANGITIQYRTAQGGTTVQKASRAGTAPAYLRVLRAGGSFSAYTSPDGVSWTLVAGSTVNVGISGAALAGVAVTSHNTSSVCTTVFDSVALV